MSVVDQVIHERYAIYCGDSAEVLPGLPDASAHLSVFSPPFADLYVYSASDRDLGNSRTPEAFWGHFGFIVRELLRVTMPGRNCCVHAADVPALLSKDGWIGLKDFPGDTIRAFVAEGWIYHGRVCIQKNPQAQAIRTHSKSLLFAQLRKDASWMRPALADYILIFRKPGDNPAPIRGDLTNDEWIEWAQPLWTGIRESDTLNAAEGRSEDDERHICPLQLGTIERCVRLWSNPDETVLTPFLGIGSEVYQAILCGRRGVGVELNPAYFKAAIANCERAVHKSRRATLFDVAEAAG